MMGGRSSASSAASGATRPAIATARTTARATTITGDDVLRRCTLSNDGGGEGEAAGRGDALPPRAPPRGRRSDGRGGSGRRSCCQFRARLR
eukprot:1487400-Prymnesium_polylepis.1